MSKSIKLNADLGEGAQIEELLMPYLYYCNIACGGHYGDNESMQEAVDLAIKHKVKIGAHPSYPDTEHFGRVAMDISSKDLINAITTQLLRFKKICDSTNAQIYHVKAHGALYHEIISNKKIREVYLEIISNTLDDVKIMLPAHVSSLELGLDESMVIYEAFGDRLYNDQLQLIPRSEKKAVLQHLEDIENQITMLSEQDIIISNTGLSHTIRFDTICLHGDHPQLKTNFPELIQNLKDKRLLL